MRDFIDVEFIDNTSYSNTNTDDIGGLVLDACWGDHKNVVKCNLQKYVEEFPLYSEYRMTESWINGYRALTMGLGEVECIRYIPTDNSNNNKVNYNYLYADLDKYATLKDISKSQSEIYDSTLADNADANVVGLKYMGLPAVMEGKGFTLTIERELIPDNDNVNHEGVVIKLYAGYHGELKYSSAYKKYSYYSVDEQKYYIADPNAGKSKDDSDYDASVISVDVYSNDEGVTVIGLEDVPKSEFVFSVNVNDASVPSIGGGCSLLDSIDGTIDNVIIDSASYDINARIGRTTYLDCLIQSDFVVEDPQIYVFGSETGECLSKSMQEEATNLEDLADEYTKFRSIEESNVSILIDYGTKSSVESNILLSVADYRSDCVAVVGYPVINTFTDDDIKSYASELRRTMFGAFYAVRDILNLKGKTYVTNGIGTIVGDIVNVAKNVNVNQLPSARTFGAYGGKLYESLTFEQVADLMENNAVNGVYNSVNGARIWGLRSLFSRATSYYSKFNIGRVVARILKVAFPVAMDVLHTANSEVTRANVELQLQTDIDNLISQGCLRSEAEYRSYVQCDSDNNTDAVTKGGEILFIDYYCYFVKLIERVHIRITATDSSVSMNIENS